MELLQGTLQDAHPIIVHFPLALLVVSVGLSWAAKLRPNWANLNETSWILLVIGALMAIPAVVSGMISHFPYESTDLHDVIERHQFSALFTTFLFLGITGWRWRSRKDGQDSSHGWLYLGLVTVGLGLLVFVGMTGGDLVYEYGVNVRGVNPLLTP